MMLSQEDKQGNARGRQEKAVFTVVKSMPLAETATLSGQEPPCMQKGMDPMKGHSQMLVR